MRFRMNDKVGGHNEAGRDYQAGDILESSRPLDKIWPHKFVRIDDAKMDSKPFAGEGGSSPILVKEMDDAQGEAAPETSSLLEVESELGENVTADYPAAADAGLLVLRKGPWHYVAAAETPDAAENEKGLKRDALVEFLANEFDTHVE